MREASPVSRTHPGARPPCRPTNMDQVALRGTRYICETSMAGDFQGQEKTFLKTTGQVLSRMLVSL